MSVPIAPSRPRRRYAPGTALLVSVLAAVAAVPAPAFAHNPDVHRDSVDLAYQIARWVAHERILPPPGSPRVPVVGALPAGVDAAKWEQFVSDVIDATFKLSARDSTGAAAAPSERPGGVYNEIPPSGLGGSSPRVGRQLGEQAAAVDNNDGDSHLWFRPTSAGGLGEAKKLWQDAWKTSVGALLAPFVCGYELFFGGDDCLGDATDMASDVDLVTKIEGLLPGFGDLTGDPFTTIWHFINVQDSPMLDNEFDDHQGLYYLQAAWLGAAPIGVPQVDPVDLLIYLASSASGLSINYGESDGPKHYEIRSGADFHRDTKHRDRAQWQSLPLGLTPLEPVDNLGKYGWDRFRADTSYSRFDNLKFPLHAIGDAFAPHHVIGVTGWGHRPYEDAESELWPTLRYHHLPITEDAASPSERIAQLLHAKSILRLAFDYRQQILAWRAAHAKGKTDLPIRDLITTLAIETRDYASGQMTDGAGWPFDGTQSSLFLLGDIGSDGLKALSTSYYRDHTQSVPGMRFLIQKGVAMTLAFLVSAMEV